MDSIPARVLKISAEIISPSLTWIFNLYIKTGVYMIGRRLGLYLSLNLKIGKM
jgi:hypothetical protein